MAEGAPAPWIPAPPWAGILATGRHGRESGPPGLIVEPRNGVGLASVIAPPTGVEALEARVANRFGLVLPTTPRVVEGAAMGFVWAGLRHWLARSDRPHLAATLQAEIGALAAISDQSDARAILGLSGPQLRAVLAKGCPVDLHPRAFGPGDAAVTAVAHIGVHLWQQADGTFAVAVPRSLAGSFWSWLRPAAAEFGCEVLSPVPAGT